MIRKELNVDRSQARWKVNQCRSQIKVGVEITSRKRDEDAVTDLHCGDQPVTLGIC